MIAAEDQRTRELLARLAPYARGLLERGARLALTLHADEFGPEHLLCALMDDEDCGAHRLALHAFADPPTISGEALSLAAGIMISGSSAALPFSTLGVQALRRARADAARRQSTAVEISHLVLASFDELEPAVREQLSDSGWSRAALEALATRAGPAARSVEDQGALFRSFSEDAKRLLSAAGKLARQHEHAAISPGHLLLASLTWDQTLERAAGLPPSRVRMALRGRLDDRTPAPERPLPLDESAEAFLARIAPGATSVALLAGFHAGLTPELAQVLNRHKLTPALFERAGASFADP